MKIYISADIEGITGITLGMKLKNQNLITRNLPNR